MKKLDVATIAGLACALGLILLGNHLDFDEFAKTLRYVAKVSDDHDDELQALGGGMRAEDVLKEG